MNGKVGALIELGAGFSPYLTGRENVYNNGAVLGFSKEEIDRKFNSIVEFAELQEFIDTPVQNYSSGMKVRLGFAVAAHMEPDILLIDEVLAVGDMGFVLKCFNHMDKLLSNSAIILVSHAMPQVVRMATDLLVMEKGKQCFCGKDISDGVNLYYSKFGSDIVNFERNDKAELVAVEIRDLNSEVCRTEDMVVVSSHEPLVVSLTIKTNIRIVKPTLYLVFYDKEQRGFAEVNNYNDSNVKLSFEANNTYNLQVIFQELHFAQGIYSLTVALSEDSVGAREMIFRNQSALVFQVHSRHHGWVPIQYLPEWRMTEVEH
jgi:lipopolysaccharide transport system ATP-binding protein